MKMGKQRAGGNADGRKPKDETYGPLDCDRGSSHDVGCP